ncbi:hypothetical protein ACVME5_009184 [Bradyrhizobium liaoningense]
MISIRVANDRLPPSAISAGRLTVCAEGAQRDQHAAEADQDSGPAPPADLFAQEDRGHRGDENGAGEIIGDDVGERQIDGGEEEGGHFKRRQHDADQLQARPLQMQELVTLRPDHRRQQEQRRAGTQEQELPDRIGADQKLAHGIAEREHEDRQHHQRDAGQPRRAVVIGGEVLEQGHRQGLLRETRHCERNEAIQAVTAAAAWIASSLRSSQ